MTLTHCVILSKNSEGSNLGQKCYNISTVLDLIMKPFKMWGIQHKFWACVTIKQEVWHIMAPWANTTTLHSIIITRSCSSLFLLLAFLAGKILARKSIEKITTFLTSLQTQNKEDVVTPFESMSYYRRVFCSPFTKGSQKGLKSLSIYFFQELISPILVY